MKVYIGYWYEGYGDYSPPSVAFLTQKEAEDWVSYEHTEIRSGPISSLSSYAQWKELDVVGTLDTNGECKSEAQETPAVRSGCCDKYTCGEGCSCGNGCDY